MTFTPAQSGVFRLFPHSCNLDFFQILLYIHVIYCGVKLIYIFYIHAYTIPFSKCYPIIIYILYITGCHRCGLLFVKKTVHTTLIGRTDNLTSALGEWYTYDQPYKEMIEIFFSYQFGYN